MAGLSERDLALFRAGDELLFRRLVEKHSPRLLAVTRSFSRDMDEAHDLLQETWRRAYEKRSRFSGSGTVTGWLYAVCRNVCLSAARDRSPAPGWDRAAGALADGGPGPDALTEEGELRASVHRAVLDLPDRERDIVILRLLEGRSTRETAEVLGCAEGTVKAGLHHALKKLRIAVEVWST